MPPSQRSRWRSLAQTMKSATAHWARARDVISSWMRFWARGGRAATASSTSMTIGL